MSEITFAFHSIWKEVNEKDHKGQEYDGLCTYKKFPDAGHRIKIAESDGAKGCNTEIDRVVPGAEWLVQV